MLALAVAISALSIAGFEAAAESASTPLMVGDWIKYQVLIHADGDGRVGDIARDGVDILGQSPFGLIGYDIANTEWIKYAVSDISGSAVTLEVSIMADGREISRNPESVDLGAFSPGSLVMPAGLEVGSEFEGRLVTKMTFVGVHVTPDLEMMNYFEGSDIFVTDDMSLDLSESYYYDHDSGIFLAIDIDMELRDTKTDDAAYIAASINAIDRSPRLYQDMPTNHLSATGVLSDGTTVDVWTTQPQEGKRMGIGVSFDDPFANYSITVTQNDRIVLEEDGGHIAGGKETHATTPLYPDDPVDVSITFGGYGSEEPLGGPVGENVVLANAVPGFGAVAAGFEANADPIPAPLRQARDGVPLNEIVCGDDGRVLMASPSGLPACVFAGSTAALEQRGFVLLPEVE